MYLWAVPKISFEAPLPLRDAVNMSAAPFSAALINWFLPVVALLTSQVVAWLLNSELKKAEFTEEQASSGELLYRHWIFVLRYIAPPIVFLALGLQLIGLLQKV